MNTSNSLITYGDITVYFSRSFNFKVCPHGQKRGRSTKSKKKTSADKKGGGGQNV